MNRSIDAQAAELLERVGEPGELYTLVYDGESVVDIEEADGDEECPSRVLCPPAAAEVVRAAEERLGFALPPLLRAVYTRIGNGGLCLGLHGLEGGHTAGEDLFPGKSAVEIYEEQDGWRREGKIDYIPPGLLPVNADLGCGMVDYVDCRAPEGRIWRSDSGRLYERQATLFEYVREAIEEYRRLVNGPPGDADRED